MHHVQSPLLTSCDNQLLVENVPRFFGMFVFVAFCLAIFFLLMFTFYKGLFVVYTHHVYGLLGNDVS